ncbi:MAG TPA: hypothetical protein VLC93_12765 [Myxococcota bacterium]|nr:hypothetical protein [Myxococcota bacterium]
MLYAIVLNVHSWWRWVVIILALTLLVRAIRGLRTDEPWGALDNKLARAFAGSVDLQVTLGLLMLFFLSPITTTAIRNMGEAMKDTQLRFFTVEHTTVMILAAVAAHVSVARARKASSGRHAHRRMAIGVAVFVALIAIGIPWPGLSHGRALFRF